MLDLKLMYLGICGDTFKSFLLILFKFILYKAREKKCPPKIADFQNIVKWYQNAEYIVAKKKSKLMSQ